MLTQFMPTSLQPGNRRDNFSLRSSVLKQPVPHAEALHRPVAALKAELDVARVKKSVLPTVTTNSAEASSVELRRSSEEFVIGAVLGPDSKGSFDDLLAACANLRKTGLSTRLVIFASHDPRRVSTEAAIQELHPPFQWVPDELITPDSLLECDVLVSLQDGVPLCVLRAVSSHIPIITTAVRIPEALRNRPNVKVIRHGDKERLQAALQQQSEETNGDPAHGFVPEANLSSLYSDTYLWGGNAHPAVIERAPKGHALIKRALFSAVPKSQLLEHGNRDRPQIAITVDDGPDPVRTPRMLDIFRDHEVKATFFVVGGAAEQYPEVVRRMRNEGHEVGSHSYSHPYFDKLSWSGAMREIGMTNLVLNRILGEKCKLFRPPHGKLSLRSLLPAWVAGQQVVMWNIDLKDYRASTGEVEKQLDQTVFAAGDIILYHGTSEPALKALPNVIESALGKNRNAVTISELIRH